MMKIGASMLGKSVVCPDCGHRIEVPFASDSRAESLYLRMKHRPLRQEASTSPSSTQSEPSTQQSSPKPQIFSNLPDSPPFSPKTPPGEVSQAVIEQVDEWIEKLWADVPDSGTAPEPHRYQAPLPDTNAEHHAATAPAADSVLIRTLWNDPVALRLTTMLFAVVFLIGIGCGVVLRPLVLFERRTVANGATSENVAVNGKLSFETPDEKLMPDVDAVVIFLPVGKIPIAPLRGRSLRPQDGMEPVEKEPSDAVQQIEELGGKYVRADAEGKFSFSVDAAGRYLGVLISSHAVRPAEAKWNAETDRNLRRFFREPVELFGNYRFRCEEYDLRKGETLSVQYNFSR